MNIVSWQPPSPNILKLNIDASFDQTTRITGLGVAIRDDHGAVVLSTSAKMSSISNSLYAEFVKREANLNAHSLVKMEEECDMYNVWENSLPPHISIL
ncbi:hypothetical protein CRYUN_Cryun41cG0063000 [Craigia yunnanensis]